MSRRTARASGSTARLVERLAFDPDLLLGMLRARHGYSRRDLWSPELKQIRSSAPGALFSEPCLAAELLRRAAP